jgi:putative ABC transport system permease protein
MALVAGQIALAVAVLTGAGLTTKSLARLGAVDLGVRPEHLVTFRVDPPWKKYPEQQDIALFYERALDRLATLPGVTGVGASLYLPLSGLRDITQTVTIEGQSPTEAAVPFVNVNYVSATYFSVMGVQQHAGRPFTPMDREGGQRVAVVSRAAAQRFWPERDPLAQRLRLTIRTRGFGQDNSAAVDVNVVGVVGDVRGVDPMRPPDLDIYLPIAQAYAGDAFFVLRTTTADRVAASVAAAIRDVDPEQSIFDIALMNDRVAARIWQHRTATVVLVTFAVATVILVAVGIYALVSFAVADQLREIGVRVALGAQGRDVRRLVVVQAIVPVAIGLAVGLPLALAGSQGLRAVLYLVSPADPTVALGVIGLLTFLALGACILPTRRAGRVDPVIVLRQ